MRILVLIAALLAPMVAVTADSDPDRAYAHARCAAIAMQTGSEKAEDAQRAHLRAGYALFRRGVPGGAIRGRATIGGSEEEGSAFSYGVHYVLEKNGVEHDISFAIKHVEGLDKRVEAGRLYAWRMYRDANCSLLLK